MPCIPHDPANQYKPHEKFILMRTLLMILVAIFAFASVPNAEARPWREKYSYKKHRYHRGDVCHERGRHRHYYGGRYHYFRGPHRFAYRSYDRYDRSDRRYYRPRRSGVAIHLDL